MNFLEKVEKKIKLLFINHQEGLTKTVDPDEKRLVMTIGEVASRLGAEIPEEYKYIENEKVTDVCLSSINCIKGAALACPSIYPNIIQDNLNALDKSKKPKVFFADRTAYEQIDKSKIYVKNLPIIMLDDARKQVSDLVRPYRDQYNGTVVTITGSFGKTTTKLFIESILRGKRAFSNMANNNSIHSVAGNIMKYMKNEYDYFVQEAGAARIGTVETEARFLRPDISVVTNIMPHHLASYGTIENLFNDKIQIVSQINEGGTAIVNFDDELLAGYDYKCNVVSFGIDTEKEVTYRGKNIVQNAGTLEMDAEYSGGTAHLKANVVGKYNAYNMLAGFAFGKVIGMEDQEIAEAMSTMKTVGTRQNLVKYGSNTFFIDCYNVANETILNSMDILMDLDPEEGGRRIAIVGAENGLGADRKEKTEELGRKLAEYDVDEIVCFGDEDESEFGLNRYGDARTMYNSLRESGFEKARLIMNKRDMAEYLSKEIKNTDAVLFKCITYLDIVIPIDKAFGTNYSLSSARVKKRIEEKTENGFRGYEVWELGGTIISGTENENVPEELKIPDEFLGKPLFGIDRRAFYKSKIKSVDLGNSIQIVLPGAFKNCKKLTSVKVPDSLMHIMRGGFRGCDKLEEIRLGTGIRSIEINAFDGCTSLKRVVIPKSADVRIEKGAVPYGTEIIRI